jgi:hypothetical protein
MRRARTLALSVSHQNRTDTTVQLFTKKRSIFLSIKSLVVNPSSISPEYWRTQGAMFEKMCGIPQSFPELLKHVIEKPGKTVDDLLVSCSHEARIKATRKIEELARLSIPNLNEGQALRTIDSPLKKRLDLLYHLHEAEPDSFPEPIVEASL